MAVPRPLASQARHKIEDMDDVIGDDRVAAVLAGRLSYDVLTAVEQAVVRAEWARRIEERVEELDLAAKFEAEGRPYIVLDCRSEVVRRTPPTE